MTEVYNKKADSGRATRRKIKRRKGQRRDKEGMIDGIDDERREKRVKQRVEGRN